MRVSNNNGARCGVCPTRVHCMAGELKDADLAALEAAFRLTPVLSAGDHVYRAGDRAVGHFHVRSGTVKTYAISSAGDEFVTGFQLPGEMVGWAQLDGAHTDCAIALETATVCQLRDADLPGLARLGVQDGLLRRLAENEHRNARRHFNLVQTGAEARVAGFFIDLGARHARLGRCAYLIPLPMSRTDIANYVGLTLATLSRVFARLQKAGVIRAARHQVEVLRPADLELIGLHAVA